MITFKIDNKDYVVSKDTLLRFVGLFIAYKEKMLEKIKHMIETQGDGVLFTPFLYSLVYVDDVYEFISKNIGRVTALEIRALHTILEI